MMSVNRFIVDPDNKCIILNDQLFSKVDLPNKYICVMAEDQTKEEIIFNRQAINISDYSNCKQNIINHLYSKFGDINLSREDENVEYEIGDRISCDKVFKDIIYPYVYELSTNENGITEVFTVCEAPENFSETYYTLDDVIYKKTFSLNMRVNAAINLSEIIKTVADYFDGLIFSLYPEDIFVNPENGSVKLLIERCLDSDYIKHRYNNISFFVPDDRSSECNYVNQSDLLKFVQYYSFRLMCVENPFDGKQTLLQYPLLTEKALKDINSGSFDFIFSKSKENFSTVLNEPTLRRWINYLSSDIRRKFTEAFCIKNDEPNKSSIDEWIINMRMLKDCFVFINGKSGICYPEKNVGIPFISINEYNIPAVENQKLYYYHIDMDYKDTNNGIIGQILNDNVFMNCLNKTICTKFDDLYVYVKPNEKIKLQPGMILTFPNEKTANIICSNNKADKKTN